jgi:hypothetical protein
LANRIKIAHTADIHFRGLSRHEEYRSVMERFFSTLEEEKPDLVLVVGDIVHTKTQNITPELIDLLSWWFKGLASRARTVITLGNHDGLLTNSERQDTVSPIVTALGVENLTLLKGSQVLDMPDLGVCLCNFCPFDETGWPEVTATSGLTSIALFLGAVNGCKTDADWQLDSNTQVGFFDGFDFAMLGDIHKTQFLDGRRRIAYPGSLIQQNFGESTDRGFLMWDIASRDDFDVRFVRVRNDYAFLSFPWQGTPEASLDLIRSDGIKYLHPRVRMVSDDLVLQADKRSLSNALKGQLGVESVTWKIGDGSGSGSRGGSIADQSVGIGTADLMSFDFLYNYVDKAIEERGLNIDREILKGKLKDMLSSYASIDLLKSGTWSVKGMNWDNTFNFGADNTVSFDSLDGLVGVFGRNRVGKSSLVATLAYALFNGNDRGVVKNLDIINSRKGYCKTAVDFSFRGKNYRATRQSVKRTTGNGYTHAVTDLDLCQVDSAGELVSDMVGEQRRETEKVLRSLIGDLDTLLRTSFAAQGQLTNFITMNPGSRKEILYSLLRLDAFDDFAKECRDIVGGIKGKLDMIPDVDFDDKIASLELEVKELESTRKKVSKSLEQGKELLVDLAGMLRDELDEADFKKLKKAHDRVGSLQEQFDALVTNRDALAARVARGETGLAEANGLVESLDIEGVKAQLEEIDRFSGELDSLQDKLKLQRDLHARLQKSVEILDSVPCEDQFPTCRFIERSIKDRGSLDHQASLVESMESDVRTLRSTLLGRDKGDLLRKKKLYEDASNRAKNYEVQLHKLGLELAQADSTLVTRRDELRHAEEELALLEAKTSPDKAQRHDSLLAQREQLKAKLSTLESKMFGLSERIGATKSDVEKYQDYARTKRELNAEWAVYDLLKTLFSRKGLPSDVLEGCLPTINGMLKQLLLEDVEFTVELVLSGDSKKLEVMLDYGDSRRIIECCSGMEKMIASLAIRGALHVVSRLPKPDFFVVDEGFGALDESNIEPCIRMLRHLLKVFKYVIVISHVDTVKDSVDTMIEIGRNGLDSVVKH